jgi:predicted nucleotidyltransferase
MKSIPRTMRGMMVLMALANLDDADAFLRNFAVRHGTRHLALFGSVLRGEDTPASDVDLLMEFEKGRTPGLLGMAEMELELGAVLGREVEVRTYEDLSRYFRDDVRAQARVL